MLIPMSLGQNTAAARLLFAKNGAARRTGRKRTPKVRTRKKATAVRRKAKRPARLVKGSKAAKAYMAKIRRKRR